jgi:hypothetical protein
LGGFPLIDLYRSNKEQSELSRDMFFIYNADFPKEDLKNIYHRVLYKLSMLEVDFEFNISPEFKTKIETIEMVTSTSGDKPSYKTLSPLVCSVDVKNFVCDSLPEENYLLIKPTGNKLHRLSKLLQVLIDHNIRVTDMVAKTLNDYEFNILYPNCLMRVYGADWYGHMLGGECIIIKCNMGSFEQIRCAAWKMRQISGLPWVKNVVHSASTSAERELMLRLFEADFFKPTDNDFKIFAC